MLQIPINRLPPLDRDVIGADPNIRALKGRRFINEGSAFGHNALAWRSGDRCTCLHMHLHIVQELYLLVLGCTGFYVHVFHHCRVFESTYCLPSWCCNVCLLEYCRPLNPPLHTRGHVITHRHICIYLFVYLHIHSTYIHTCMHIQVRGRQIQIDMRVDR